MAKQTSSKASKSGATLLPPRRSITPANIIISKPSKGRNGAGASASAREVIDMARKQGAKMVDVKFVDTFGTWQHFSVPVGELTEEVFTDGFGFDGSSIRGWKSIEASDMLAMPDPVTAFIDPFCAIPTLSVTCTIAEP